MTQLNIIVLNLIKNNTLYFDEAGQGKGSISIESFESSFDLLAAIELPNIEKYTFFYRKYTSPNLVMSINVAQDRITALLRTYDFFKHRLETVLNPSFTVFL
ncbi:hypothetical protein [Pontibacter toksunensis]|uniref:hypothetical protein n=1 Tax=Pontibacter toksunensis TaxID=1332631 RepID=UPI00366FFE92